MTINSSTQITYDTGQRYPAGSAYLPLFQIEGLTFTPDGLHMIATGELHEFQRYDVLTTVAEVRIAGPANTDGVAVPVGSGDQIKTMAVGGANKIIVKFSADVPDIDTSALSIDGTRSNTTYTFSDFDYDPVKLEATWTLANTAIADQLVLTLDASSVLDIVGNELDGEWVNPTDISQGSSDTFPSGNGAAGGDFSFYITLMPDFDGGNHADFTDLGILLNNYDQSGKSFADGDADGSGKVDFTDLGILLNNYDKDWEAWDGGNFLRGGSGSDYSFSGEQLEKLIDSLLEAYHSETEAFTVEVAESILAEFFQQY